MADPSPRRQVDPAPDTFAAGVDRAAALVDAYAEEAVRCGRRAEADRLRIAADDVRSMRVEHFRRG